MTERIAVYAGSFDPVTEGHMDLAVRALSLFDRVILAIGHNPAKSYHLPLAVRKEVLEECVHQHERISVDVFNGLLVDYCRQIDASAILRGLRAVSDFEFEFQIGLANMDMAPEVQTVFMLSEPRNIFISSSLVREIMANGGDIQRYVPEPAYAALLKQSQR